MPVQIRETLLLRALGLTKIPMLFFIGPTVTRLDDEVCAVRVPLGFRTKNHLGSMYFGALAAGADCAGGLAAMLSIRRRYPKVNLIFKDMHAEFLKRADGDVEFRCEQVKEIEAAIAQADQSGERV